MTRGFNPLPREGANSGMRKLRDRVLGFTEADLLHRGRRKLVQKFIWMKLLWAGSDASMVK